MGGNMSGGDSGIEDNESEVHLEGMHDGFFFPINKALIVKAVRKPKQAGNNPADAQHESSHDEDDDDDDDDDDDFNSDVPIVSNDENSNDSNDDYNSDVPDDLELPIHKAPSL